MSTIRIPSRCCVVAIALLATAAIPALASGPSTAPDREPVRPELENQLVRATRMAVPAHGNIFLDALAIDSIVIALRPVKLRTVPEKGTPEEWDATPGSALWIHAGVAQSIQNESDSATEILSVALLSSYGFSQVSVPESALDPVDLDPRHFHAGLKNEQVRVLFVHVGPRDLTQLAQFAAGLWIEINPAQTRRTLGDDTQQDPQHDAQQSRSTVSWDKAGLYSIENVDTKPYDGVLVELRRPFCYKLEEELMAKGPEMESYALSAKGMIRKEWRKSIPREAKQGEKGLVVINFKIQSDGSVHDEDILLMSAFAREPLIDMARAAIQQAGPFPHFPAFYQLPSADFQLQFIYNLPIDPGCK